MAKIVITITDEPEGSHNAVDIELVGLPAFDPTERDSDKLTCAQLIGMAMLRVTRKRWTTFEESPEIIPNNTSEAVQ
jgi:hypothetical protein